MILQDEGEEVFVGGYFTPISSTLVANRAPASRFVYKNFLHTLVPDTHCPNNSNTSTVVQKKHLGFPVDMVVLQPYFVRLFSN